MIIGEGEQQDVHQIVQESHLQDRLMRPLTEPEKSASQAWLEDAWEDVRGRVPNLDERRTAGQVSDGQLRKVLAAMVVRVLRNPNAIRQYTVDGDNLVRDSALSAGLLYVTPEDVALLSGVPVATGGEQQHISFSVPYQ